VPAKQQPESMQEPDQGQYDDSEGREWLHELPSFIRVISLPERYGADSINDAVVTVPQRHLSKSNIAQVAARHHTHTADTSTHRARPSRSARR
jgi:hypothetical protein